MSLRELIRIIHIRARGLQRFHDAQDTVNPPAAFIPYENPTIYGQALRELRNGHKESCWMWFVFPQAKGLGTSTNSRIYALSKREACAYLQDPVLWRRLACAITLVEEHLLAGGTLAGLFGDLDALKFRSSMELFASMDWFPACEMLRLITPNGRRAVAA